MKQILWGRVLLAAVVVELLVVVAMVLLILLFAPSDLAALPTQLVDTAAWVRPLGGLAFCIGAGWWVARKAGGARGLENGLALGLINAALDMAITFAVISTIPPEMVLVVLCRITGGWLGGWLAARRG